MEPLVPISKQQIADSGSISPPSLNFRASSLLEYPARSESSPRAKKKSQMRYVNIFSKGFGTYLQMGFFSDLVLVHLKKQYHVHTVSD